MNIIEEIKKAQTTLDALVEKAHVARIPVTGSDSSVEFENGVVLDHEYEFDDDLGGVVCTVFTVAFLTEKDAKKTQEKFAS